MLWGETGFLRVLRLVTRNHARNPVSGVTIRWRGSIEPGLKNSDTRTIGWKFDTPTLRN